MIVGDGKEPRSKENSPVRPESEMSTIKVEEEEEANLCLEILHDPRRFYDNLGRSEDTNMVNLLVRRLSVISSHSELPEVEMNTR